MSINSIGKVALTSDVLETRTTGTIEIGNELYKWSATKSAESGWAPLLDGVGFLMIQNSELVRFAKGRIIAKLCAEETIAKIRAG